MVTVHLQEDIVDFMVDLQIIMEERRHYNFAVEELKPSLMDIISILVQDHLVIINPQEVLGIIITIHLQELQGIILIEELIDLVMVMILQKVIIQ